MSVSSILAFVLAGAVAKNRRADRRDEKRIAELIARIASLEHDVARANAQAKRDQELIDIWRARALSGGYPEPALQRPAGPDFRPPHVAQQQAQLLQSQAAMQQMQLAQQSQGLAQYAQGAQYNAQQNLQNYQHSHIGLLGAQGLIDAELWCNCVPSRSQVWAATDPE